MPLARFVSRLLLPISFAARLSVGVAALAAESPQQPAPVPAAQQAPDEATAPAPDLYTLPAGGAETLAKFIDQLQTLRPSTTAEIVEYREKAAVALKAAAEKILELDKDPKSSAHQKARRCLLQFSALTLERATDEEQRQLLDATRTFLTGKQLVGDDVGLAMLVADRLERAGAESLAAEAFQTFAGLFAASAEPRLTSFGELCAGSARRLKLVGQPMELTGTKLDGTKFTLADWKGKVVLVDFWATWCGPCREEIPSVKRVYQRYHALGLEVVGVSVDRERKALEQFVTAEQVPWVTLFESDPAGVQSATRRYGILGIPSMFLVGRDGKVLSTHARGEELQRLLAEQFAEAGAADKTGS